MMIVNKHGMIRISILRRSFFSATAYSSGESSAMRSSWSRRVSVMAGDREAMLVTVRNKLILTLRWPTQEVKWITMKRMSEEYDDKENEERVV